MATWYLVTIWCLTLLSTASVAQEPTGQAIQIVNIGKSQGLELDIDGLSTVLLHPKCRDNAISIVSIAGATRKGKSFLLNFLLRYLKANGDDNWMGDKNSPLQGFSWRGGSQRDTTGILLWSEPFLVKLNTGQQVCMLLMDTQGAFDGLHTVANTAAIFALSTMTSSVQVFNLFHNIQEDDLQHLELFTEYGRLALDQTGETPFQKLLFLVRDWPFAADYDYGLQGGQRFLRTKLAITKQQTGELERVRKNIRACFRSVDCFLMPHPGMEVARSMRFDGRLADIDAEFLDYLSDLVPYLMDKKTIQTKKIGGQEVTGMQLVEYFKSYIRIFADGSLPEPTSILEATAQANNQAALASARDHYIGKMEAAFGGASVAVTNQQFQQTHQTFFDESVAIFHRVRKMGGEQFSKTYLNQFQQEVNTLYKHYNSMNHFKIEMEQQKVSNNELRNQVDNLNNDYKKLQEQRDKDLRENTALGKSKDYYMSKMDAEFGSVSTYLEPQAIQQRHEQLFQEAVNVLVQNGGSNTGTQVLNLRQDLNKVLYYHMSQNDMRKAKIDQANSEKQLRNELDKLTEQNKQLETQMKDAMRNRGGKGGSGSGFLEFVGVAATLFKLFG
ncbi:Atlastin-1 [Halotydeus destructor]|nr:Atlastin-1 [Halotydeus destructor]